MAPKSGVEQAVRDIRRQTRKPSSAAEKIRIVLSGLGSCQSLSTRAAPAWMSMGATSSGGVYGKALPLPAQER